MDTQMVWQEMQKERGKRVFLFYGKEDYLWEEIIAGLKQKLLDPAFADLNYTVLDGKTAGLTQVLEMAVTLPFLDRYRLLVVRDVPYFQVDKKAKEKGKDQEDPEADAEETGSKSVNLNQLLQTQGLTTCVIFTAREVDKRLSAFKRISKEGMAAEFASPRVWEMPQLAKTWADKLGKKLMLDAANLLVENTLGDSRLLRQELEKLSVYVGTKEKIELRDVQAVGSKTSENNIFALMDSLGARNKTEALRRFGEMLQAGEPPVRILVMLSRQVRLILECKLLQHRGCAPDEIAGIVGAQPFQVRKGLEQSRNFSESELQQLTDRLLQADEMIKTGQWEAKAALEIILCRL